KKLSFAISKRALRYDLTVPFARFVVMNQSNLAFPFKRYQIQPVWRADRPGKGRYQEFYQCDVDIIGSDSLLNEVELVQIFDEVLSKLKLPNYQIRLNNRKILSGLAVAIDAENQFVDLCTALDKLDKIGTEKVLEELRNRGLLEEQLNKLNPVFEMPTSTADKLEFLKEKFMNDNMSKGLEELEEVLKISNEMGISDQHLIFDPLLARGLNYYTGAIYEVIVPESGIGSICGGGRYDDLTGIFGLPNMSGVGVSFGADRIYDVMEHFNLFPETTTKTSELMFVNFGKEEQLYCMKLLQDFRSKGVKAELYPSSAKMQKQMKYANQKGIKWQFMFSVSSAL
ncbi:MAG: histidine--tRNA ligase, partial [Bacteroidota bacterium]